MKVLVGYAATPGHHTRAVSPDKPLNKKKKKSNRRIKKNIGKNGLGKNASMTGIAHLLQRHPQITHCILGPHCTHMLGLPLTTSPTHMVLMRFSSGNSPFPMDTSPIERFVFSSRIV
jgi:hypothetical protein